MFRYEDRDVRHKACSVSSYPVPDPDISIRSLQFLQSPAPVHKGLVGSWGTDWPVNDTVKYAKETVGLGTCIPQRYVKSEEKDKANFLYTITAPGNKYFQYHTTFTSMKETFGYKTPEAWFAHLREWKEELAHPVTVRIKDNRTNK